MQKSTQWCKAYLALQPFFWGNKTFSIRNYTKSLFCALYYKKKGCAKMSLWEIIFLAVGLSADAAAVSISNTLCLGKATPRHALSMALSFGIFQGIMPLIGYYAATSFSYYIKSCDHWIAFILLAIIGGKMLYESIKDDEEQECSVFALSFKLLMVQAIATSIDALAVGISFSVLDVNIFSAVAIISLVTFLCSLLAVAVAKRFGTLLGKRAGIVGGLILIFIGVKIFVEHMFFS